MYIKVFKRLFDLLVSTVAFILLSPIFIVFALLLLVANRGSVFFIQPRPGVNERIFKIIKFKTMNDRKDEHGELLPDGVRLTPVGKFVRKTSIDEIPQLLNVIKGDMSLIGPRPLMVEYLPYYDARQKRRHDVRPGITGWAQINGRNSISWAEKFELDVYYVDNISFALDVKIFMMTIKGIFDTSNISPVGHATMPKFSDEQEKILKQTI